MLPLLRESHAWKICRFRVQLLGQFLSSFKDKIESNLENKYNAFLHTNIADQNADFPPLMRRVVSGSGGVEHQATVSVWNVSRTPGGCGAGHI